MQGQNENLVFKDTPYSIWLIGIFFGGLGAYFLIFRNTPIYLPIIFIGIGLLLLLLSSILTVTVDRSSGTLVIKKAGIIVHSQREIEISMIEDIYIAQKTSTDEDGTSTTYQIRIVLNTGEEVPLRKYSSGGYRKKAEQVQQLQQAIGR